MNRLTILILVALIVSFSAFSQKEYYELSDTEYAKFLKLKDKKQITLKDGSLAYIVKMEEIAIAGFLTREQLNQLRQAVCLIPLAPGAPCQVGDDCRKCPTGYVCTSITPSTISLDLQHVDQSDLPKITEKGELAKGNIAIIRPATNRCMALPSNARN